MGFLQWPKPLSKLPRFADLSEREMRRICEAGREVTVPDGWSFISELTPADKAYLIIDGTAAVLHHGEEIAELGPGDLVGEVGIRDHKLRTASVAARTPLKLLHWTKDQFQELYEGVPAFRRAVDATVEARTGG